MQSKEEISKRIWRYLDGDCTIEEKHIIESLIQGESTWADEYKMIRSIHHSLKSIPADQPSMRFSKNILERLASSKKAFIQPQSLLSTRAKWVSVAFFTTILMIVFAQALPSAAFSFEPSPEFLYFESAFNQYLGLLDFHIGMNVYFFLIIAIGGFLLMDHLLKDRFLGKSSIK